MTGTKLAHYEITSHIGSGGMGDVYQATDTKLGRSVAIKFLPEAFSHDTDRVARFQREARVLASLNHPNIAAIHGVEEIDTRHFLVMELVSGETLADRIKRGPIPIEEALPIAKQIAEALEEAHEKGIIHRDLKPANIKVTPEGRVKVLDFGLAKAYQREETNTTLSNSPTISMAATKAAGVILGTAAYMSPEQARGEDIDRRSDIFSFGCVLYEMLTGKQAFQGQTVSDILAGILRVEPDFALVAQNLNPRLRELLRRCLDKNAKRRWQAAGDLKIELETIADHVYAIPDRAVTAAKFWISTAVVLFLIGIGLATLLILNAWAPRDSAVMRYQIPAPDKTTFDAATQPGRVASSSGRISPDGRKLAFTAKDEAGKTTLWVRGLDSTAARPLPGTEDAGLPFWSPDSRSIAFFTAPGKLKRIDVDGGPVLTLANAGYAGGGTWNRQGVIVFGLINGLFRMSAVGGDVKPVTKPLQAATPSDSRTASDSRQPSFLPDGKQFLFFAQDRKEIFVGSLENFEVRRLLTSDSPAIYAPPGYLLFVREGTLLAQPFDPKKLELTADAVPIAEQVSFDTSSPRFSVSENGTLTYRMGQGASQYQLVWVDRSGKVIESTGAPGLYRSPAISPDGKRIAIYRHEADGGDVWIVEASGGKTSRLTFNSSQDNAHPIWAGGNSIIFLSHRNGKWGIYQKLSNGTGGEELLFESNLMNVPMSWSAAANTVLFLAIDLNKNQRNVWALPLNGDRKAFPVLETGLNESHPQISPNGKWLAYYSNETGRSEIYVQSFPAGRGKWQISNGGGQWARWRADGKELFYMMGGAFNPKIVAVSVHATDSTFEFSTPQPLFDSGYINIVPGPGPYNTFDVSADGQRFIIPRPEASTAAIANTPIEVVLNWTALLNKK